MLVLVTRSAVPSLPASRTNNIRQKGAETPSHPGGISDTARQRLEEYRKKRDKRGDLNLHRENMFLDN